MTLDTGHECHILSGMTGPELKAIRRRLNLCGTESQQQHVLGYMALGIDGESVRRLEMGRRNIRHAYAVLLTIMDEEPDIARKVLDGHYLRMED